MPADTISHALWLCPGERLELAVVSGFYQAPAQPDGEGPDYIVSVAQVNTALRPADIMTRLRRIETAMGQGDGSLSADVLVMRLLAYGDLVEPDTPSLWREMGLADDTTHTDVPNTARTAGAAGVSPVPDPSLHKRADLLVPLAEIAPDWVHPVLRKTAAELVEAHPAAGRVALRGQAANQVNPPQRLRDVAE